MADLKNPMEALRSVWLAEASELKSDEKQESSMPLQFTSADLAREVCITVTSLISDVIRDAARHRSDVSEDELKQRATAAGLAAVAAMQASFSAAAAPAAPKS